MDIEVTAPLPSSLRIGHLDSLTGIRAELKKVYRDMRKGRVATGDGTRFIYALMCLAKLIQQTDFDERLKALSDQELLGLIEEKIRTMEARQNGVSGRIAGTLNGKAPTI